MAYTNLFYGIKLENRTESINLETISKAMHAYFIALFSASDNGGKIVVTKKALKEAGIAGVDNALECAYYACIQTLTSGKPAKNVLVNAVKAVNQLYKSAGIAMATDGNCFSDDWKLVQDCLAISATGGKTGRIGVNKTTSLPAFKKAWLSVIYSNVINQYSVRLNKRQRAGIEKRAK